MKLAAVGVGITAFAAGASSTTVGVVSARMTTVATSSDAPAAQEPATWIWRLPACSAASDVALKPPNVYRGPEPAGVAVAATGAAPASWHGTRPARPARRARNVLPPPGTDSTPPCEACP